MEFRQILYFDAVCKTTSISKAAQDLFVTQQCVSKQISMLEKELGTPLLVRKQSGITLTEEGQWLREHAAMILQIDRDIKFHFEERNKTYPLNLKIGVTNGLSLFYDELFFQQFRAEHPDRSVQVLYMWNQQIEEMLENKMIDIGISVLPVQSDSLYAEKLFTERFYCIVNRRHKLADRESLSLDDILHEKLAMADENYSSYHTFQKKCEERGVVPDVYKSPDLMAIYEYVLNHYAIGFSLKAFADRFHIDQIRYIPHSDPDAVWEICFLTRDTDRSRYQELAKDFSRDRIKIR